MRAEKLGSFIELGGKYFNFCVDPPPFLFPARILNVRRTCLPPDRIDSRSWWFSFLPYGNVELVTKPPRFKKYPKNVPNQGAIKSLPKTRALLWCGATAGTRLYYEQHEGKSRAMMSTDICEGVILCATSKG